MFHKQAILFLLLFFQIYSQSFTPANYSVTPNYAKSASSLYSFNFNAVSAFTANFDLKVYYPSQFALSTVSNCGFWINGNAVSSMVCSVSPATNQIVFSQLNISASISNIRVQFNTTTSRYSGSSTLIFYYYNVTTNLPINSLTNYVSITIVNAVMTCSLSSTSSIVGDNVTYTLSYNPLVPIQANSIFQIQLPPWGAYSQSNFITTNISSICNGACSLSVPSSNGNISELVRYSSLFASESSSQGTVILSKARNPPSTKQISISVVLSAKISSFSQQQYMSCSTSFFVTTPNSFRMTSFATSTTSISASNTITLRIQLTNPISSFSYLRIQPNSLTLSYQFNNYNQGTSPFQATANDGSILLGNLTQSTTSSPSILTLNNFTLINPPYANKAVTVTITTQNLIDSSYFLVDRGTADIISTPSTISEYGVSLNNTSINGNSRYNIWFRNVNRLISSSFIILIFPSTISLSTSTCILNGISSSCIVNSSSTIYIDINTLVNAQTNLSITINSVTNPPTTTPTSSITIQTFYEDSLTLVDQLLSGLIVQATSVLLRSANAVPSSLVVGQSSSYTVNIQNANMLPLGSLMKIKIPLSQFISSNVLLSSFTIGGSTVASCSMTRISPMYLQFQANCFPNNLPALSNVKIILNNITNPSSTKPTSSWQIQTIYNGYQMQYMNSGIIVSMNTPTQITAFTVTPTTNIVNNQTSYLFQATFVFPHVNGDRVILNFPDGVLLGVGFTCTSTTQNVTVNCVQSSQNILQTSLVISNGGSTGNIQFRVSSITNNWFVSTRSFTIQTTTNDTTYYYVETGQTTISFNPATLGCSAISSQQIILLGQSTVKLVISSPFTLSRVTNYSDIYLTLAIPNDLTLINNTCSTSNSLSTCKTTGQNLNITNFGDFSTNLTITFQANTNYFAATSVFQTYLNFISGLIASDTTMKLSSYCTSPCKQCTSVKTQCISCLPSPYTVNNTYFSGNLSCVNTCPITFYQNSGQCLNCDSNSCYGCSVTPTNCTSCAINKNLFQYQCLTTCPSQYYALNGTCQRCISPCLTCASGSICQTCISNYFLDIDKRCVTICSNISYIGLDGQCQLCINNCKTCSKTLSNCTSCQSSRLLYNNNCVTACSSGFYNNANITCQKCVSPCLTCASQSICQTCITNYFLFNQTTCTLSCPDGTLPVINVCQKCDPACSTCSLIVSNCTSCSGNLLFYLNSCLQTCPPLTYPYNKRCTTCITPCQTCASSPSLCTTCIENLYLFNSSCVTTCPTNGFYTSGTNCLPCSSNCLQCQTLSTCNLCSNNYYLFSGGCVLSCPDSHPIINNRQCMGCAPQCSTCAGTQTNCTTCTVFYFRYTYTCVKQCPLTYYSNINNYTCQDGLSTKIVFFPVLITSIVVIFFLLIIKCFTKPTSLITTIAGFMSPLEMAIWCYVFSQQFATIKQLGVVYQIPIGLFLVSIISFVGLNIIFFFVNRKKMSQDEYAIQWGTNNLNYTVSQIVTFVSLALGCKFFRILYSRMFNSIHLSLAYRHRSNVFTVATIFTICFIIFCEIPAIVSCWYLTYNKTLKDQTFYTCIQGLIVTIISMLFSLFDIYKSEDFFEQSEFCKIKKYVEKVKDYSSMNRIEQGFDISHEEASVDAQKFVSTSGGKFFYSKQRPEDIKDQLYFQESEVKSQVTDTVQRTLQNKKNGRLINIFAPIIEEEAQNYQNEKYPQQETQTQAKLQQAKRKIKSVNSDEEDDLQKNQRKEQAGLEQGFDDTLSVLGEREMKKKWNNIIDKRMRLAQKIFNRHPPDLAQIDQPPLEDQMDQLEEGGQQQWEIQEQSQTKLAPNREQQIDQRPDERIEQTPENKHYNRFNEYYYKNEGGHDDIIPYVNMESIPKKKKKTDKRKKHISNRDLQQIYLQRLTDKKKSSKDMFSSDKSLKYDF